MTVSYGWKGRSQCFCNEVPYRHNYEGKPFRPTKAQTKTNRCTAALDLPQSDEPRKDQWLLPEQTEFCEAQSSTSSSNLDLLYIIYNIF